MLIIKDLSSTKELDRKALADVTGGRYRFTARSIAKELIRGGVGPYNPDPTTGGELAEEYDKLVSSGWYF